MQMRVRGKEGYTVIHAQMEVPSSIRMSGKWDYKLKTYWVCVTWTNKKKIYRNIWKSLEVFVNDFAIFRVLMVMDFSFTQCEVDQ